MNEFKPVAWLLMDGTIISEYSYNLRKLKEDEDIPLFTQRTWVELTDEEIKALASWWPSYDQIPALMVLAKDIQNSLKEKNT